MERGRNELTLSLVTPLELAPNMACIEVIIPWGLAAPLGTFNLGMYTVLVTYGGKTLTRSSLVVEDGLQPVSAVYRDFEMGTTGNFLEGWSLGWASLEQGQYVRVHSAKEHHLFLVEEARFGGGQSLYATVKLIPPQQVSRNLELAFGEQFVHVWISSDWISAPGAKAVEIQTRDVGARHVSDWGYGAYLVLVFEDKRALYPNTFSPWYILWDSPQLLYGVRKGMGAKDTVLDEVRGNDGRVWGLYRISIPEEVDRERFDLKIFWIAHDWNSRGPGKWGVPYLPYIDGISLLR